LYRRREDGENPSRTRRREQERNLLLSTGYTKNLGRKESRMICKSEDLAVYILCLRGLSKKKDW